MKAAVMERGGLYIQIDPSERRARKAVCDAEAIRCLSPDEPFNSDLIDTIPGLLFNSERDSNVIPTTQPDACRTVHLGTEFWQEIHKPSFGDSKMWVRDIPRQDLPWSLPIYEDDCWIAILIDWKVITFRYYDEVFNAEAEARRERIVEVSIFWAPLIASFRLMNLK
jgi:hypothetical protein